MIGGRTGGLDTQVRNRMMQNPMQLQQNYKQKGDILDLIALQMIKSEQDKKKKSLMLKMQQNPNTIKQQVEKAVMQQTKNDLVQQTGGLLALKNARQQQNLQKVAAGKSKPPPVGIAQPFQKRTGAAPTIANPLGVMASAGKKGSGIDKVPARNMQGMRRAAQGGIIGFAGPEGSVVPDTNALNPENFSAAGIDSIVPQLTTEKINELLTKEGSLGSSLSTAITGGLTGDTTADAEERAKRLIGFSPEVMGRYKDLLDKRRNIGIAQLDPEKLRNEQLLNFLGGVAGSYNLAGAGERGTRAVAKTRKAQEEAALKQLTDEETSFRNMVGDIYGQQGKILASVDQAADRDTQKFGSGLTAGTQILAKQMDTLNDNARLLLDAKIADSNINAEYNLEEMRKNVQLAIKTADVNVRAQVANLQADTELKARKYDTDVRAATDKKLSADRQFSSLQQILAGINQDLGKNKEMMLSIYAGLIETLNYEYSTVVKEKGIESTEAVNVKKQIDELDKKIKAGVKILNGPLGIQKKDITSKLTGITVSGP
jgi:hypothetical protein